MKHVANVIAVSRLTIWCYFAVITKTHEESYGPNFWPDSDVNFIFDLYHKVLMIKWFPCCPHLKIWSLVKKIMQLES